jgi:hypothetical protein
MSRVQVATEQFSPNVVFGSPNTVGNWLLYLTSWRQLTASPQPPNDGETWTELARADFVDDHDDPDPCAIVAYVAQVSIAQTTHAKRSSTGGGYAGTIVDSVMIEYDDLVGIADFEAIVLSSQAAATTLAIGTLSAVRAGAEVVGAWGTGFDGSGVFTVTPGSFSRLFFSSRDYSTTSADSLFMQGFPTTWYGYQAGAGADIPATIDVSEGHTWGGLAVMVGGSPPTPVGWDVYAAAAPNGSILATLDGHVSDRFFRVELDGTGSGGFRINRHDAIATADVIAKGNIVKVRIPAIDDDYIAAFVLEQGDFELLDPDEEGGEVLEFGGRGILAYLDRAIMWSTAYSTGLDISDVWTEVWERSFTDPVGIAVVPGDTTDTYVIGQGTRKISKIRQSDRAIVRVSPALFTHYASGLSEDPSDSTILWALEAPWLGGSGANAKIYKVRISDWAILATFDLGSSLHLTDIRVSASNIWTTNYSTDKIEKRSKTTGALVTAYTVTYAGVAQTNPNGIACNGTELALFFDNGSSGGSIRALIVDVSAPATVLRKVNTTAISTFGGAWTTESSQDYFYVVSSVHDRIWKYQLTAASPHDPVDGIWRLDEATAGAILWRLMQEWQHPSRPQHPIPDATYAFTSTLDSDGNAWATHDGVAEFDARIGDKGVPTVVRLPPYGVTVQMLPSLELVAVNDFGTDRSSGTFASGKVRFEGGKNVADRLTKRLDAREVDSDVLVGGDANLFATAADHDLGYTVEGFVGTQLSSATALAGTGTAELDKQRKNADAAAFEALWGPGDADGDQGYIPGPAGTSGHYWIGDTVRLHSGTGPADYDEEDVLVYAITVRENGDSGRWQAFPELGSELLRPSAVATKDAGGSSSSGGTTTGSSSGTGTSAATDITLEGVDDSGTTVTSAIGRKIRSAGWSVYQEATGVIRLILSSIGTLLGLNDVDADDIADGQVLVRDGTEGTFVPGNIEDLATAELDPTKRLAPNAGGGVEWAAGAAVTAADVTVADAGAYFAGADVEAVLQELAAKELGYSAHGNMGATETFNALTGWHSGIFNANCIFTFTGATSGIVATMVLELTEDGTGGYSPTWPASVIWPGGAAPVHDTTHGTTTLYLFESRDGGANWFGQQVGGVAPAALIVKDEGSALATAAASLDFVGAGVTASGAGAGKTITIPGGGAPSGAAGGDLSGTYPNPTVAKVQGVAVTDAAGAGALLRKSGSLAATWALLIVSDYPYHDEVLCDSAGPILDSHGDVVMVTGVPN